MSVEWRSLNYEQWSGTCDTLHAHTQVLGKLAAVLAPPEPQLQHAALRLTARGWESLPLPEDVLLLIEVSDTTLSYDRGVKLPLYARAGIREVWIADLAGEAIERNTYPSEDGYRTLERARRGEKIEPTVLPELSLGVDAVLG